MKPASLPATVLAINGGSSSIRFALYDARTLRRLSGGRISRIGLRGTNLVQTDAAGKSTWPLRVKGSSHRAVVEWLLGWIEQQPLYQSIRAVGHRVVHGMRHAEPARITPKLLAELRRTIPYDPEHVPRELELIDAFRRRHSRLAQVACFDTTFHRTMPRVARMLAIPRRYARQGVERYGFHGLSYTCLLEQLTRLGDHAASDGRIIMAHLGNGASLAAVRNGKSIDTSMGFTPAAGLPMSTRSGDLDPGILSYLSRREGMTSAQFEHMVNHQSGLLGISGTSPDMRDLCAREGTDPRAADAIALFCYQVKKWIGAYAAALDGLDTLVFAGGIGENIPLIRSRICAGLGFLGLALDQPRNGRNAGLISATTSQVIVRVMHTDEEFIIARAVTKILARHLRHAPQP